MFEFDFENKDAYKGIERDIKNYKAKDKLPIILKIVLSSLLGSVLTYGIINIYNITNIFIILASIIPFSVISESIIEITNKFINKTRKNKAKKNLDNINNSFKKNNILTNTENISNSIVIKQSNRKLNEVVDDGKLVSNEEVIHDNYYLFLDNDENINGVLERNAICKNNDVSINNTFYYILEDDDIKSLENRVKPVKKLVKKVKNI